MKTLAEREIKPKEITLLTVEVLNEDKTVHTTYSVQLYSVRDGFAFCVPGEDHENGPYCLDGGWLQCMHDGGVRLTGESLALCTAMVPQEGKT